MQAKKEVSIAIFIGLIIGAVIIGGVYRAKTAIDKHLANNTQQQTDASAEPNPSSKSDNDLPLVINSPIDGQVTDTDKLTLSGNTKPHTYITILTEKNEYIIMPNELGDFSQEISLVKGANTIVVTVYTKDGNKTDRTLNLVYTTADL